MKIFATILIVLVLAILGYTFLVDAQSGVCGDRIVQTPNSEDAYERCDDGDEGSDLCTDTCDARILGWAWADSVGWISLSSLSCKPDYVVDSEEVFCPITQPPAIEYGVLVDSNQPGTVTGYAWSDNVGFICFGSTCASPAPGGQSSFANLDVFNGQDGNYPLQGWANVMSLGDEGWISLNCTNNDCENSTFNVMYSQASFNATVSGRTLTGWAWNANDNDDDGNADLGLGWINFNPEIGALLPWLQTRYGDIYSQGNVTGNPAPSTAFNATYRILAGGAVTQLTSFFSGSGLQDWISPNFGPIDFPTPDTRYSNVLGNLDIDGLIAEADVELLNESVVINQGLLPGFLNGQIYYREDNLIINPPVDGTAEFINGTGFGNGSGTIIVDGDLTINTNIVYDLEEATRFRNLSSVAWIVRGDLHIDESVEFLAGNFIVLGNDSNCDAVGCGRIFSCSPLSTPAPECDSVPLNIYGLMMARGFEFDREFTGTGQGGSEVIIYDGRLLANTPPGLADFAKALPIWRAGTFER